MHFFKRIAGRIPSASKIGAQKCDCLVIDTLGSTEPAEIMRKKRFESASVNFRPLSNYEAIQCFRAKWFR